MARYIGSMVLLSYPGQTGVYWVRLLERGSGEDIPEDVLLALQELGWIESPEKLR